MEAQKGSDLPEVTSYEVQGTLTQVTSNPARLAALGGSCPCPSCWANAGPGASGEMWFSARAVPGLRWPAFCFHLDWLCDLGKVASRGFTSLQLSSLLR